MSGLKILGKSKPIKELKKGDSIWINGIEMKVDAHHFFMRHKGTNEMIIEIYNPNNEKEYQIRYFDDQVDTSIEVYELLNDFQYVRKEPKDIRW